MKQEELKELIEYNPETGIFTWKKSGYKKIAGQLAGSYNRNYLVLKLNYKRYQAHRLAWLYVYGEMPDGLIDHINGDPSDNRISNLRLANHEQNGYNSKLHKTNTSGIKGVSWCGSRNKWLVQLSVNGKTKNIGRFDDLEFAELVAHEARDKFHGKFANHGVHKRGC